MVFKDFLFQNLYYLVSAVALLSALVTYLYFYNREVLSFSPDVLEVSSFDGDSDNENSHDRVFVDLSGAVDRPGIYSLKPGDRLADLLALSGGVTNEVSQKWLSRNLNLSSVLKDQQKIYIPFEWEVMPEKQSFELKELVFDTPSSALKPESSALSSLEETIEPLTSETSGDINLEESLVNLNEASKEKLMELPRVGEVTAKKIIDNRPYSGVEELEEKTDIYASTIEKIQDLIAF